MSVSSPRAGVLAALWIPTDADGRLMEAALAAHLEWLRRAGVQGVLALGSTGEFPRFSLKERMRILEAVAAAAAPLPVIANISDLRPEVAAELGRFARKLGLPAVAMLPPYFFPLAPEDQLAFFLHGAEAAGLPAFLYNFPERTGNRIDLATVAAFADRAPLAGIKQSGGEFSYHAPLVALGREKNFVVFSGADTEIAAAVALGAAGCIGGLVNLAPEYMLAVYAAARAGQLEQAAAEAARLRALGRVIDRLAFPLNVAAGLEARGFDPGAPKFLVSAATRCSYQEVVREIRRLGTEWGLPPVSAAVAKGARGNRLPA
jgi:4-hydroxy-tetrahydrodipicolinate synthase